MTPIFDKKLLPQKHARSAEGFAAHDFLFQWAAENLRERLGVVQRDFETTLQIGARGPELGSIINLEGDIEHLPEQENAPDLIISNLHFHAVNDLPGALLQIRKALRPDGLFLAALPGGETLHELRASLMQTELSLKGGVSPRVFPFADKQDLGALMQRAGFALPVIDSDRVIVTYDHMFKLLADLRGMGEGNIIAERDKNYVGRDFFLEATRYYHDNFAEPDDRIPATFEIIFLLGWAPHDSQQKPMKPGSAKERLAHALETKEKEL